MAQPRNAKLYIGEHAIPIGKVQEVDVEPLELDDKTRQWIAAMQDLWQAMAQVFRITFDTKHTARRRYKRMMARQQNKRWEDIK